MLNKTRNESNGIPLLDVETYDRIKERIELMYAHSDWKARWYREDMEEILAYLDLAGVLPIPDVDPQTKFPGFKVGICDTKNSTFIAVVSEES